MSYIEARRQEERDRRRTEIVDAADAVYAESGWDSVTMDQVARRARLSRALVYVYFKDKSDLHLALVERSLDVLRDRFEAARHDRANGFEQLELGVYSDNARAIHLYEKFGFERYGIQPRAFKLKDGTYRDEIIMVKML